MKPKLFVDGRAFDKYFEGTRTYVENLYKIIDQIGDFEIFIGSETNTPEAVFADSKNIRFVRYQQSKSKMHRAIIEIPKIISDNKIQASHFQYVTSPLKKSIQVVTIHDILFKDFPEQFSFNYRLIKGLTFYLSAVNADIVTTVSQYSKDALVKHFKLKPDEVHIIPNGVASGYLELYDKAIARKSILAKFGVENYILYVSRIEPRKNQLDLLKAYLELKLHDKNIRLVFIGKKDLEVPELDVILKNLPADVNRYIHFLTNIGNDDLKTFYQAAKIFVYPSLAEGFGIPPLEAAALSVPTICSNRTAMRDFTFFGENHIDPNLDSIKKVLLKTINEPVVNTFAEIKQTIAEKYNWTNAAIKLNKLIWDKMHKAELI